MCSQETSNSKQVANTKKGSSLQRINDKVYNHVLDNKHDDEYFSETLERLLFHVHVNPVFDEIEMRNRSLTAEVERLRETKEHLVEMVKLLRELKR